jgi:hypothetical protein
MSYLRRNAAASARLLRSSLLNKHVSFCMSASCLHQAHVNA